MSDALYDLTLVVPCYNEADNIPLFYKTATECFEQAGVGVEIVFVNDGSQASSTVPIEPFLCFAIITSATFFLSVS